MRTFNPTVECLEDRLTPIIHSFSAGAVASESPNAAGSETARAAILNQSALGATPPPVVAAGDLAEGVPFDFVKPHVPGRDVVLSHE
jgi:hypothetical protein